MKTTRRLAGLGLVMIAALTSLVLGGAPASAAPGSANYENVGNPGWCLANDGTIGVIRRCGPGQTWLFSDGANRFTMRPASSPDGCLTAFTTLGSRVNVFPCDGFEDQLWNAWGTNGWIVLKKYDSTGRSDLCVVPVDTHIPGRATYRLQLSTCPTDVSNVPNRYAWRYF